MHTNSGGGSPFILFLWAWQCAANEPVDQLIGFSSTQKEVVQKFLAFLPTIMTHNNKRIIITSFGDIDRSVMVILTRVKIGMI